jgi:ABC-type sulfate/molybdate transport systems ATPase subunit
MTGEALVLDSVRGTMEWSGGTFSMDLRVPVGEFLAVTGPSRSGKSLLLELCAGLALPQTGHVVLFGSDWAELSERERAAMRLRIGVVLQQPGLLSNMTVYNNVALPLRYHWGSAGEAERHATVMAGLEALDLIEMRDRFPAQLTAGEARCAAIARALILRPDLLLLDDVAAGLDAGMIARLQVYLSGRRRGGALTILATFRAPSPLLELADRVALLRGGRVDAVAPRETVLRDADSGAKLYLM